MLLTMARAPTKASYRCTEAAVPEVGHIAWAPHPEMAPLAGDSCQALPAAGNGSFDHWKVLKFSLFQTPKRAMESSKQISLFIKWQ